jgi:YD repeat-containing protein
MMKIFSALAFTIAMSVTAHAQNAAAQSHRSVSGASGRFIGRVVTHGNGTSGYTADGRFTGSSVTHGNLVRRYDANGRFIGTATKRGNTTFVYDRNGRLEGRAIHNRDGSASLYDRSGRYFRDVR